MYRAQSVIRAGERELMAFDTVLDGSQRGSLLKEAVHRSGPLSIEGIWERLFTFAFSGLVYPQIWEDPAVDLAAMEIEESHHIVAIASGGCNVLSYLTASPARITAVDLNRAHVSLTRLKLAGLRHLPGWPEYYRFFGEADERQNVRDYVRYLRPVLDRETRRYWEGRGWTGQRRIRQFQANIYRRGLLGRFIGLGHLMARLYGSDPKVLLACRTLEEQRTVFQTEIGPLLQKRMVRWFTGHRLSLYGLGIPPAQYEALAGGVPMAEVLHERLERLACGFPLRENYFAWQAFGRCYAPGGAGPLPPYLAETNFARLRSQTDRVRVMQTSLTSALDAMPAASVDRFVLLDAQDWMTDLQLNALWRAISHSSASRARVIFRTAGRQTILPGRVDGEILGKWRYLEAQSKELGSKDRSSIYGGFHIYERSH
jgi:S-adenosylmethionine-diacylglycerol 3-amino-3-carboxypropyl transferase